LNSFRWVGDPGREKFGSGIEKIRSGIRDKHPGSATLFRRSVLATGLRKHSAFVNALLTGTYGLCEHMAYVTTYYHSFYLKLLAKTTSSAVLSFLSSCFIHGLFNFRCLNHLQRYRVAYALQWVSKSPNKKRKVVAEQIN
jgi:hypothetical protein